MKSIKINPFNIIGISVRTTNEKEQSTKEIADLWEQFMSKNILSNIPNKVDYTIYSLYTEYEGDYTKPYTVIIGCKVNHLNEIPEGMIGKSFEGGNFIQITTKGDLTKGLIVNQWSKIWSMNLDRTYSVDFEVFGEKAQNPNDAEVDFLIAVQ